MIRQGEPLHVVERSLREWGRKMSLLALEEYIKMHGTGDVGPATVLPGGEEMDRLPETKLRPYLSAFGPVNIERTVYSAGHHQREDAPLDAVLGLPEGKFSFLLQDFAQLLGVDLAWAKDREVLERLLGTRIPVSSLEDMNRRMAAGVPEYRQQRESPPIEQEGAILVASGDGKGIVMRKPQSESEQPAPSILPPATKGPPPGRKNMSVVGTLPADGGPSGRRRRSRHHARGGVPLGRRGRFGNTPRIPGSVLPRQAGAHPARRGACRDHEPAIAGDTPTSSRREAQNNDRHLSLL